MAGIADTLVVLIPVGALAGFSAGLFGIGGGVVTVVALVMVLPALGVPAERVMHVALGTSLAAIVMTATSSTLSHHRRGAVRWPIVVRFAPAVALGALLGGAVAHVIPGRALRIGFGLFLLWAALRLSRRAADGGAERLPSTGVLAAVGAGIGVLSSWTGIGGGSLTGPYLISRGVAAAQAVATSAAVGFPLAVAGAVGYGVGGWSTPGLPAASLGYVFWPAALVLGLAAMLIAPLGARLAHALPERVLKRTYAVLLAVAAVRVTFGG